MANTNREEIRDLILTGSQRGHNGSYSIDGLKG